MKVYYSFERTEGMRKNQGLSIIYENQQTMQSRFFKTLNNVHSKPFFERDQTEHETDCAKQEPRVFSVYSLFFKDYNNINDLFDFLKEDDKYFESCDENEFNEFKEKCLKALQNQYNVKLQFKDKKQLQLL